MGEASANDNQHWSGWRVEMWAKALTMTRDEAAAAFLTQWGNGPVTFGVRLTVFWMRHVLVGRLAA